MKHRHSNRILGRVSADRNALLRNLARDLLQHGSIVTTHAKASELRKFVEPLITEARKETTLARRRLLLKKMHLRDDVAQLLEVAKTQAKRPGGYLRLTKLISHRHDAAPQTRVELVK